MSEHTLSVCEHRTLKAEVGLDLDFENQPQTQTQAFDLLCSLVTHSICTQIEIVFDARSFWSARVIDVVLFVSFALLTTVTMSLECCSLKFCCTLAFELRIPSPWVLGLKT